MGKIQYSITDKNTTKIYYYTKAEWYLAIIIIFLAGFIEGIIFTYFFK